MADKIYTSAINLGDTRYDIWADVANSATFDSSGNNIADTLATKLPLNVFTGYTAGVSDFIQSGVAANQWITANSANYQVTGYYVSYTNTDTYPVMNIRSVTDVDQIDPTALNTMWYVLSAVD